MTRISVCVPTLDGVDTIAALLAGCDDQDPPVHEIVVVDSGSTDGTVEVLTAHPRVRLVAIDQSAFGHGRTRNQLAELATGDVVAYLTQDAAPAPGWARWLAHAFEDEADVAAVVGRQVAPPTCCPPVRHDLRWAFAALGPADTLTTWASADHDRQGWRATALSNSNCAYRRDVVLDLPFRDVDYAEDQAFAADALAAGLRLAYEPRAVVAHGHDLRLRSYYRRQRAEARGVAAATGWEPGRALKLAGLALRDAAKLTAATAGDRARPLGERLAWLPRLPAYAAARRMAARQGWRDHRRSSERSSDTVAARS